MYVTTPTPRGFQYLRSTCKCSVAMLSPTVTWSLMSWHHWIWRETSGCFVHLWPEVGLAKYFNTGCHPVWHTGPHTDCERASAYGATALCWYHSLIGHCTIAADCVVYCCAKCLQILFKNGVLCYWFGYALPCLNTPIVCRDVNCNPVSTDKGQPLCYRFRCIQNVLIDCIFIHRLI